MNPNTDARKPKSKIKIINPKTGGTTNSKAKNNASVVEKAAVLHVFRFMVNGSCLTVLRLYNML
jgi:hypothetical protein